MTSNDDGRAAALRARKPDPFCTSCGVVLDLHGTDEPDDFDCQIAAKKADLLTKFGGLFGHG